MTEICTDFSGLILAKYRKKRDYPLKHFQKIGISLSHLSQIENLNKKISKEKLYQICQVMEIDYKMLRSTKNDKVYEGVLSEIHEALVTNKLQKAAQLLKKTESVDVRFTNFLYEFQYYSLLSIYYYKKGKLTEANQLFRTEALFLLEKHIAKIPPKEKEIFHYYLACYYFYNSMFSKAAKNYLAASDNCLSLMRKANYICSTAICYAWLNQFEDTLKLIDTMELDKSLYECEQFQAIYIKAFIYNEINFIQHAIELLENIDYSLAKPKDLEFVLLLRFLHIDFLGENDVDKTKLHLTIIEQAILEKRILLPNEQLVGIKLLLKKLRYGELKNVDKLFLKVTQTQLFEGLQSYIYFCKILFELRKGKQISIDLLIDQMMRNARKYEDAEINKEIVLVLSEYYIQNRKYKNLLQLLEVK